MKKRFFTDEQVDLIEQIDDCFTWLIGRGYATQSDVESLQELIDNLAESIKASEKDTDELVEESPWTEED